MFLPLSPLTLHCWLQSRLTPVASYTHRPCLESSASPGRVLLAAPVARAKSLEPQPPAPVSQGRAEIPQAAGASIVSQECIVQHWSFLEWLTLFVLCHLDHP